MNRRGATLGAVVLLAAVGFVAGRQGGTEPAASDAAVPVEFQADGEKPGIAALPDVAGPPALAREKKRKENDDGGGGGGADTLPPDDPTPTVVPTATVAPPVVTQVPPNPTQSPPDIGGRDE